VFLLDTNIPSELIKPAPEPRVRAFLLQINPEQVYVSAITVGEIKKGILLLPASAKRARLEAWFEEQFLLNLQVLPVDQQVAELWAHLSAEARLNGISLTLTDGLISATVLLHDYTVVTRNEKDFKHTGARVLNPWLV
jgi:predicted nucleic acid-binding protein